MKARKKIIKSGRPSSKKTRPTPKIAHSPRLKTKKSSTRKTTPKRRKPYRRPSLKKESTLSYQSPTVAIDTLQPPRPQFDTAATFKETKDVAFHLPSRYNDDRIAAMTRDPWWIHAYWDISQKREEEVVSRIPDDEKQGLRKILRIHDVTGIKDFTGYNANDHFDIEINDFAANWYINVDRPGSWFCIDIGFRSYKGNFYLLARSNITKTPNFGISSILDEEWYLPDDEYFRMLGIYDLGKSSLQRRRKLEEMFKRQISSFGASEAFSLMQRKLKKKFFLQVHTELILYGKTEPDAQVTLKGKKIALKKDGTFSFRFALPLGKFEFPIEATSASGKDRLKTTPVVERTHKKEKA